MSVDFKIKRSISEDDIPAERDHRDLKYDPIAKSCKTLDIEEGIEIEVNSPNQVQGIRNTLKKRLPRLFFSVTTRKRPTGHRVYIIRKS